jgi:hypothetical protein
MRLILPALAACLMFGCGPGIDPLIGSYTFTMTGLDTNTAPNTNNSPASGGGTVAITANAALTGYVISVGQNDLTPCVIEGTAAVKATDPEITVTANQTCTFALNGTSATATITSGKAVVKLNATRPADTLTLDVTYSYTGSFVGFSFVGNGKRTYTGTRR